MHKLDIAAEIEYSPYAAYIAHTDWEYVFYKGEHQDIDAFNEVNDLITRESAKYRLGIVKCLFDQTRANNKNAKVKPPDPYLFNPASFVAIGDSDALSIIPIDDFDPTIRLTSDAHIPVRQTCLSFCPTLKSLHLDSEEIFCELDEVCKPGNEARNGAVTYQEMEKRFLQECQKGTLTKKKYLAFEGRIDRDIKSPILPFTHDRPLVAVTYFKLNSLAILGPGLLMQQAAYKVMADCVKKTHQDLLENAADGKYKDIQVLDKDVESFRCLFLDPQGWADIATVMFCRNYSVMASIISALRCITLGKLMEKDQDLQKAISAFGIHKQMSAEGDPPLAKNHLFWATYTTLGITFDAFATEGKAQDKYSGIVLADTKLKLYPGHLAAALNASQTKYNEHRERKYGDQIIGNPEYAWYMVGHDDFLYEQLQNGEYEKSQAIPLNAFFEMAKDMRDCTEDEDSKPILKHILDAHTDIRLPIVPPKRGEDGRVDRTHVYVTKNFAQVKDSIFGNGGLLSSRKLKDSIRALRIPAPLSRSIIYLYNDYAQYLSNPFSCESVLDLWDIFATTHHFVTEILPADLQKQLKKRTSCSDRCCRAYISEDDMEQMIRLIELMQESLSSRMQVTFAGAERWDLTIDVRGGGLRHWLHAADAPLRCWLSILDRVIEGWLRKQGLGEFNSSVEGSIGRKARKVGGVSRISQNPRSLSRRIMIGDHRDVFLASVDLNITHLTRPGAFCIHLHEVGHLIYDLIYGHIRDEFDGVFKEEFNYAIRKLGLSTNEERERYMSGIMSMHQDIFAEMLIHRFMFDRGEDFRTYFRKYMVDYSFEPKAHVVDSVHSFNRLFAILLRGFFITDPFRVRDIAEYRRIYDGPIRLDNRTLEDAFNRFIESVEDAGPFYFDFHELWEKGDFEKKRFLFREKYTEFYRCECDIWDKVNRIYNGIYLGDTDDEDELGMKPPDDVDTDDLIQQVRAGLESGRPLTRMLCEIPGYETKDEKFRFLNASYLLKLLFGEYIASLYGPGAVDPAKTEVCLCRNSKDGYPDFNTGNLGARRRWHKQLVDRNLNGVFTTDAETRYGYMRKRITVIKTLWDMSTNFRARRMREVFALCDEAKKRSS